jgi:uncharacterized membrane protein YkoI
VQSRVSHLLHKQEETTTTTTTVAAAAAAAAAAADDDDDDDDNDEEDDDALKKPNEWPVSEKYSIIVRLLRFPDKKAAQTDGLKRVYSDDNFCLVNI